MIPSSFLLFFHPRLQCKTDALRFHLLSTALTLPSLKADFRLLSARCDRGFTANAATISKLQLMAADLEAMATADANQTFAPTASDDLLGKWYLDFCDAGYHRKMYDNWYLDAPPVAAHPYLRAAGAASQ